MNDPSDLFNRTRYLSMEISAALLSAATAASAMERGRVVGDVALMHEASVALLEPLIQALALQLSMSKQIAKELAPPERTTIKCDACPAQFETNSAEAVAVWRSEGWTRRKLERGGSQSAPECAKEHAA